MELHLEIKHAPSGGLANQNVLSHWPGDLGPKPGVHTRQRWAKPRHCPAPSHTFPLLPFLGTPPKHPFLPAAAVTKTSNKTKELSCVLRASVHPRLFIHVGRGLKYYKTLPHTVQ
jgi:hypothetical protein